MMTVTSTTFKEGEKIPALYTCEGRDINPPLRFSGVPGVAQSLALIMNDPDAPMGTWTHWMIWNIQPTLQEIPEHYGLSQEVEGWTSAGTPGYHGPCPPSGVHRYFFKLYALDTMLDISTETDAASLMQAMEGHIIDHAQLIGTYQKSGK